MSLLLYLYRPKVSPLHDVLAMICPGQSQSRLAYESESRYLWDQLVFVEGRTPKHRDITAVFSPAKSLTVAENPFHTYVLP